MKLNQLDQNIRGLRTSLTGQQEILTSQQIAIEENTERLEKLESRGIVLRINKNHKDLISLNKIVIAGSSWGNFKTI